MKNKGGFSGVVTLFKRIGRGILTVLLAAVFVICVLLAVLGSLFAMPFALFHYRRTPYYRETKTKYSAFIAAGRVARLYNRMRRENLPIIYVKQGDYEYFIRDDTVLCLDWDEECFEQEGGVWRFINEEDEAQPMLSMEALADKTRRSLKEEHRALPIKFVVGETCTAEKPSDMDPYFAQI